MSLGCQVPDTKSAKVMSGANDCVKINFQHYCAVRAESNDHPQSESIRILPITSSVHSRSEFAEADFEQIQKILIAFITSSQSLPLDILMLKRQPHLAQACIVPFVVYLLGSSQMSRFSTEQYPIAYAMLALITALTLWWFLPKENREQLFVCHGRIGWGVMVGTLGIAYWIAMSHLHLEKWLTQGLPVWLQVSDRASFNPLDDLTTPMAKAGFILVRLTGIAILVPVAEELFWRAFLLRWTIDPEWQRVPLGSYTWQSCLMVTALFTLAHPEWFAAAGYCLLINGLLYWKRDLWQCIIAHAVSNFLLVIYVLLTGHWWLW
jgi:CAAX prenyl protease-like protein